MSSTSRKSNARGARPPPCSYYLRGTCTRGTLCTFSHTGSPASTLPKSPTSTFVKAPCKFFQQGRCKNGLQCPFGHPSPDRDNKSNTTSVTSRPPRGISPDAHRSSDSPSWRSGSQTPMVSSIVVMPSPCKYFLEGRCTKGDKCNFPHIGSPSPRKARPTNEVSQVWRRWVYVLAEVFRPADKWRF